MIGVFPLRCAVQKYAWGKVGDDSAVARLARNDPEFKLDPNSPYAELWMGTHPKAPSVAAAPPKYEGISLADLIENNKCLLGKNVEEQFEGQLPFLFKVLSVNKSLSIQAHPTKEHAATLHRQRPDLYPDPNHKPEMAIELIMNALSETVTYIALTTFEALVGFRPASEVLNYLHEVPEFLAVVGQEAADQLINAEHCSGKDKPNAVKRALRQCFTKVMKCNPLVVKKQLSKLVARLQESHDVREDTTGYLGRLFMRIYTEFPGDVGCLVIYFLNHVILEPGEAIFLGPNYPHAYLSGDCIECMSRSDNVVRAGLTPKYKDVDTLCWMLDYEPKTPKEAKFHSKCQSDEKITLYSPPIQDFSVSRIVIPKDQNEYAIKLVNGPSIILIICGEANASCCGNGKSSDLTYKLSSGSVLFIGANELVKIINKQSELVMFRAFCQLSKS